MGRGDDLIFLISKRIPESRQSEQTLFKDQPKIDLCENTKPIEKLTQTIYSKTFFEECDMNGWPLSVVER